MLVELFGVVFEAFGFSPCVCISDCPTIFRSDDIEGSDGETEVSKMERRRMINVNLTTLPTMKVTGKAASDAKIHDDVIRKRSWMEEIKENMMNNKKQYSTPE